MKFRSNSLANALSAVAIITSVGAMCAGNTRIAHAQALQGQIIATVDLRGIKNTSPLIVPAIISSGGVKEGQPFDPAALAAIRQKIIDTGYYSDVYVKTDSNADRRAVVTIEVFENPIISEVRIRTNVPLNGRNSVKTEDIIPRLGSQANNVVNVKTVQADARLIQDAYRKAGFDAYLSEISDVFNPKTNVLTFPVTITVINKVIIEGLHKTKPFVVTREMKSKEGEPLNKSTVQADTTRIFATNLFSDVANPHVDVVEEGKANLVIPVTEQRTGQVQVGFGYSVEQRLTGTLQVSENNFRGVGQGVSASWTVGGATARNQFELGFTEPWLDKNNTSLAVSLYDKFVYRFNSSLSNAVTGGTSSNPYYEEHRGAAFTLSRPVTDFTRVFTTLRTESVRTNNLGVNYGLLGYDQINNIQGSLVQSGDTYAVAFSSVTKTRDNERDPANGFYFSPSVELGYSYFDYVKPLNNPDFISPLKTPDDSSFLLNQRTQNGPFSKYQMDYRHYLTLDHIKQRLTLTEPKHVLATHLVLGSAIGNIGFSEQYFMGGADDLRGYADSRFWGNYKFLLSNEYRAPIAEHGDLTGVLFVDIGDAWGGTTENRGNISGFGQHTEFRPNLGYGFGVRIKTPVGVVRLDYGIGETSRTHFSIGQAF